MFCRVGHLSCLSLSATNVLRAHRGSHHVLRLRLTYLQHQTFVQCNILHASMHTQKHIFSPTPDCGYTVVPHRQYCALLSLPQQLSLSDNGSHSTSSTASSDDATFLTAAARQVSRSQCTAGRDLLLLLEVGHRPLELVAYARHADDQGVAGNVRMLAVKLACTSLFA